MIDSAWLVAFLAFAEDANLSRAAKRLHLSQPAVHAQLRKLSDAVGVPLYQRVGRGLQLTREGAEVAAFARDAAERERELVARLGGTSESDPHVVLAAGAGALLHVLGEGLRAFGKAYAGRLEIVTADTSAALAAVTSGAAHLGVVALGAAAPLPGELDRHQLTEVGQMLVMPKTHRLAGRRRVRLEDLADERLVVPPAGRPQRVALETAFAERGVRLTAGAIATGWELVVRLVELGAGLGVVNASVAITRSLVARPLVELPRVRYVAFTRRRPRPDVALLAETLVAHGDAWRKLSPTRAALRNTFDVTEP